MSKADTVLAVVGEERITVGDFESELSRRTHDSGIHYTTQEQKRALLEEMIEFKVLLQKARAAGFDRDPELRGRFDRVLVDKYEEVQLATNSETVASVNDENARAFYQRNQERYATPESVRVAIIYFRCSPKATYEKRAEARQRAEGVLAEARRTDAPGFRTLAQRYSDDQATRYSGGDIGWLARGENGGIWGEPFETAAFSIRVAGDCAPLLETSNGFYIVRLVERKPASVRPFDEVKDAIAYQLARERQQQRQIDLLEDAKRGVKIESNPSLLQQISTPERVSDQEPPSLPNG